MFTVPSALALLILVPVFPLWYIQPPLGPDGKPAIHYPAYYASTSDYVIWVGVFFDEHYQPQFMNCFLRMLHLKHDIDIEGFQKC